MNLVISNSECIWASLASQSCVKYKVNIVRKSDKKKQLTKSSSYSSTQDPKDILTPAFCPHTSPPSPQYSAVLVSRDGGDSQLPRYHTHDAAVLETPSAVPCTHAPGNKCSGRGSSRPQWHLHLPCSESLYKTPKPRAEISFSFRKLLALCHFTACRVRAVFSAAMNPKASCPPH